MDGEADQCQQSLTCSTGNIAGHVWKKCAAAVDTGEAKAMTTLVQSGVRQAPVRTSGFGVILLWSLLGLALSLGAAHFGLDFSNLSS
jgi:hypothetical protein